MTTKTVQHHYIGLLRCGRGRQQMGDDTTKTMMMTRQMTMITAVGPMIFKRGLHRAGWPPTHIVVTTITKTTNTTKTMMTMMCRTYVLFFFQHPVSQELVIRGLKKLRVSNLRALPSPVQSSLPHPSSGLGLYPSPPFPW